MGLWGQLCGGHRSNVVSPITASPAYDRAERTGTAVQVVLSPVNRSSTAPHHLQVPEQKPQEQAWPYGLISPGLPHSGGGVQDAEDLLARAAIPGSSWALPMVSLASLQAAFQHAPQAIAVMKLSSQPTLPNCCPGIAFSTPGTPKPTGAATHRQQEADGAASSLSDPKEQPSSAAANSKPSAAQRLLRQPSSNRASFAVHAAPQALAGAAFNPARPVLQWDTEGPQVHEGSSPHATIPLSSTPTGSCGWVSSALSRSSTQRRSSSEEAGAQLAQLEPVFLNAPLKRMLDIKELDEYAHIMDRQLLRNPMMVMLFENSVRRLMAGKATSVRQYMPHFAAPCSRVPQSTTTFVSLCITACALADDDSSSSMPWGGTADGVGRISEDGEEEPKSATPALFLWYDVPSSQAELTSQLKRDYMALSHIPSMVTVVALDGRVLHQNGCSAAYMGFLMGTKFSLSSHIQERSHTLRRLFALEPEALDDMLRMLADNKMWHGLVRMPAALDLTEPPTPEEGSFQVRHKADCLDEGPPQARRSRFGPGSSVSLTQDDLTPALVTPALLTTSNAPTVRSSLEDPGRVSLHEDPVAYTLRGKEAGSSSWPHSTRNTRSTASSGGSAASTGRLRRASWSLAGKPFFDACQKIVLGNRSMNSVPSTPSSASVKQSHRSSWAVQLARESQEAVLQQAAAIAGSEAVQAAETRWHQIQASKFQDPVTGEDVIMLIQTDATARVRMEEMLQQVLDAEHALLEEVFPRQVLESMTAASIRCSLAKGLIGGSLNDCQPLLLAQNARTIALQHEQVSIMFADIVGFTTMAKHVEPVTVMTFLNDLYTRFDALLSEHQVYKVETIGDCYMVAGGLVFTDADGVTSVMQSKVDPLHAQRVFNFAKAMLATAGQVPMPDTGLPVRLRVGIHSGPVVSGVVGTRMPRFCLFGDTVNTANRMESTATPNSIHVSDITQQLIGGEGWEATGGVQLKGRGMMESYTYWLDKPAGSQVVASGSSHGSP